MIKVDVRNVPAGRRGQGAGDEDDDEQDEPRATRGNNQWGATGTLRCIPCRQRKCKVPFLPFTTSQANTWVVRV